MQYLRTGTLYTKWLSVNIGDKFLFFFLSVVLFSVNSYTYFTLLVHICCLYYSMILMYSSTIDLIRWHDWNVIY
ncbi:hypothetical protein C8Q75DRAFT_741787 [Abortiporus biennis]|nr:hypothetical protein C8Q75DRAFT_741787 [Abortiporus biennis]